MKKALSLLLFVCGAACADDAAVLKCRALSDTASRLACYDAMPVGAPVAAAPAATAAPAASATERFGMGPAMETKSEAQPASIRSSVVGELRGWGPGTRITLANGQVWRVSEGEAVLPVMTNPRVEVERTFFGSYFLKVEGQNSAARVKRVQ